MANKSLKIFFVYLGLYMIEGLFKFDVSKMSYMEIIMAILVSVQFNFIYAVPGAIGFMVGTDIYIYIKDKIKTQKKKENEKCRLYNRGSVPQLHWKLCMV